MRVFSWNFSGNCWIDCNWKNSKFDGRILGYIEKISLLFVKSSNKMNLWILQKHLGSKTRSVYELFSRICRNWSTAGYLSDKVFAISYFLLI